MIKEMLCQTHTKVIFTIIVSTCHYRTFKVVNVEIYLIRRLVSIYPQRIIKTNYCGDDETKIVMQMWLCDIPKTSIVTSFGDAKKMYIKNDPFNNGFIIMNDIHSIYYIVKRLFVLINEQIVMTDLFIRRRND